MIIKEKILFVGCGKMGSALLGGFAKKIESINQLVVLKKNINQLVEDQPDNLKIISNINDIDEGFKPDIVIFAVKPQIIADVITDYKKFKDSIFVSVIAGKEIDFFERNLGNNAKIIRTMPNLPCLIGEGITAIFANCNVSKDENRLIEELFKTLGDTVNLTDECQIDSATAISGSGPAYIFHFAESLIASGIKLGLSEKIAQKLALKTMFGSCKMMIESSKTPTELKIQVTSKKGTTEAALNKFYEKEFSKIIEEATKAAKTRAKELN